MRILCISDTHGKLPDLAGYEYDLVIHAGDVCGHHPHPRVHPKTIEDWEFQKEWLCKKFVPWVDNLKSPIVMVAGNHDFVFQQYGFLDTIESVNALHPKIIYLKDSVIDYKGVRIAGFPWSKFFFAWAFNLPEDPERSEEAETALYAQIPDDVNIVISHGGMYGILDKVEEDIVINRLSGIEEYKRITYTGSRILKERLKQCKQMKLFVSGHIHQSYGMERETEELPFIKVNASVLNEQYKLVNPPIIVEI